MTEKMIKEVIDDSARKLVEIKTNRHFDPSTRARLLECEMEAVLLKKQPEAGMGYEFDGALLKRERIKAGFKTYELFHRALKRHEPKVSRTLCWQWENGSQPSMKYVYAIAAILKKDPKYFLKKS